MRFAAAYGFRNIQNVVLKLKKGKFPYHFVEVLACAGGKTQGPRLSWAPLSPVGNGPYWPPPASLSSKGFVGVWMLPWWLWRDGPSPSLTPTYWKVQAGRCHLGKPLGDMVPEKSCLAGTS